jgi:segregation and condensation protein A
MEGAQADILLQDDDIEGADVFVVDLEAFEGPLHLLLDLAQRRRVDLSAISMHELADQYLAFINEARLRRLDLAAAWLVMAAHLALLKSRLLLPKEDGRPTDDGGSLADQLAYRLQRLAALRGAGEALAAGRVTGRDVFVRGAPEAAIILRRPVWSDTLLDLMRAFADINTQKARTRPHIVARLPVLTLEAARARLRTLVREREEWTAVQALPPPPEAPPGAPSASVLASFFAASLELAREREIELRQDGAFEPVYVRRAAKRGGGAQ